MTPAEQESPSAAEDVEALRRAHDRVRRRIAAACLRRGRAPEDVELVAVSKGVTVERLRAAVAAGLTVFGESRVQEAEAKIGRLESATWHLVGRLQSNKAGRAVALFEVVQSLDSVAIARRLDRVANAGGRRLAVYLEVNVDADPSKAGFAVAAVEEALPELATLPNLELRGLMTVGRMVRDPEAARPTFAALADLAARLRARVPALGAGLSMGMSDDFEVAVEEGATVVRIGRAVFGQRPGG